MTHKSNYQAKQRGNITSASLQIYTLILYGFSNIFYRIDNGTRMKNDLSMLHNSWMSLKRDRFLWPFPDTAKRTKFPLHFPDTYEGMNFPDMVDTLYNHKDSNENLLNKKHIMDKSWYFSLKEKLEFKREPIKDALTPKLNTYCMQKHYSIDSISPSSAAKMTTIQTGNLYSKTFHKNSYKSLLLV